MSAFGKILIFIIVIAVGIVIFFGFKFNFNQRGTKSGFAPESQKQETISAEQRQKQQAEKQLEPQPEPAPSANEETPAGSAEERTPPQKQASQPQQPSPPLPSIPVNKTSYGRITKDEIWRGEVHIIGDIEVARGVTLTIEPGTNVRVAANRDAGNLNVFPLFDLKKGINTTKDFDQYIHRNEPYRDEGNHISIRINGTLIAVGRPDSMISIASDGVSPGRYDWNVFSFANGELSYVVMENYRALDPGNGTRISNSIFRNVGECAICANSTVLVENSTLTDAGHELVDMHNSSPVIRGNQIGPNPDRGCFVIDGGSPTITGNIIKGCVDGINYISPPGNPVLGNNTFIGNEENIAHNY